MIDVLLFLFLMFFVVPWIVEQILLILFGE